MQAVTAEVLREELLSFALTSLKSELEELSDRLKKDVQQEFKQFLQVFDFWTRTQGSSAPGLGRGAQRTGTAPTGGRPATALGIGGNLPANSPNCRTSPSDDIDLAWQTPSAPRSRVRPSPLSEDLDQSLEPVRKLGGFGEAEAARSIALTSPSHKRRKNARDLEATTPKARSRDRLSDKYETDVYEVGVSSPVGSWVQPASVFKSPASTVKSPPSAFKSKCPSPLSDDVVAEAQFPEGMSEPRSPGHRLSVRNSEAINIAETLRTAAEVEHYGLEAVVNSQYFHFTAFGCVLLNAFMIGLHTDYAARNIGEPVPTVFHVSEVTFCIIFVIELSLRIYVNGLHFFVEEGWLWNIFDCFVVGLQVLELILQASVSSLSSSELNVGYVRVLRVLYHIRFVRTIRILSLISELRALAGTLSHSLVCLGWALLLFLLVIFIVAVALTQIVSEHRVRNQEHHYKDLELYYGSLGCAILSLFQAITGGIDWAEAVTPLRNHISPWLAVLYSLYVAFGVLAMMNVITGTFLERTLQAAKEEEKSFMINNVHELFSNLEGGIDGALTWPDFESRLHMVQMQAYFKAIDVDPTEAKHIFRILDADESGAISAKEFVHGIFSFRGSAKALDQALLMHELRQLGRRLRLMEGRLLQTRDPSKERSSRPPSKEQRRSEQLAVETVGLSSEGIGTHSVGANGGHNKRDTLAVPQTQEGVLLQTIG